MLEAGVWYGKSRRIICRIMFRRTTPLSSLLSSEPCLHSHHSIHSSLFASKFLGILLVPTCRASMSSSLSLSTPPSVADIIGGELPDPSSFPASHLMDIQQFNATQQRLILRLYFRPEMTDSLKMLEGKGNDDYQRKRAIRILVEPIDNRLYPTDWLKALVALWRSLNKEQRSELIRRALPFGGAIVDDVVLSQDDMGSTSRLKQTAMSDVGRSLHQSRRRLESENDERNNDDDEVIDLPGPASSEVDDEVEVKGDDRPALLPVSARQAMRSAVHKRSQNDVDPDSADDTTSSKRRSVSEPSNREYKLLVANMRTSLTNYVEADHRARELTRLLHEEINNVYEKISNVERQLSDQLQAALRAFQSYERMLLSAIDNDTSPAPQQ